ncbi:xenotropic and polytropic retrovirus receptor 1 homolog [Papaver somniferum]|uniref:xenotropic and polytropic retrovirus receptor 1 homolog n=1 Tax=Papaver somniferum TaxID=3469 RepID=UPI000E704F4D|nr:xenotropic and polytropic retrovirus receptor 1 homolog [Papaver somniferum]
MKVSSDFYEAYVYFNGHALMLLLVVSWGCMRSLLTMININHGNARLLGPTPSIWLFVVLMISLILVCVVVFLALLEHVSRPWPPIIPVVVYPVGTLVILACLGVLTGLRERAKGMLALRNLPRFRDLFLADLLTSVHKAFADIVCSLFRWYKGPGDKAAWDDDAMCGGHYIVVTIAMSIPFLIRFFQCIREWNPKSTVNAAKYSLSLAMLVFNALDAAHSSQKTWRGSYILVATCSSFGSFMWDILVDWNMVKRFKNQDTFPNKKHGLLKLAFYGWFIGSDLIMRFIWLWKIFGPNHSLFVFFLAALELFRRFQWVYFRIERAAEGVEHAKETKDTLPIVQLTPFLQRQPLPVPSSLTPVPSHPPDAPIPLHTPPRNHLIRRSRSVTAAPEDQQGGGRKHSFP